MNRKQRDRIRRLVGRSIRERREGCDISQAELARALKFDRSVMSKVEAGKIGFDVDRLVVAADELGCDPSDLLLEVVA